MTGILTVTLNPALDQTVRLDHLRPGAVHRARSARIDAGGKGVNVASCLADWGLAVAATGVIGRANAAPFEALFAKKAIKDRFLRVAGATRTNVKLVDDAGTTDINLPGLTLDETALDGVAAVIAEEEPGLLVLAGSVPDGLDAGAWARLLGRCDRAGRRVVLDTSGAALLAVLDGPGPLPFAVKPNAEELEQWTGRPLADPAAIVAAARRLTARGLGLVAVSRGADGSVLVTADAAVEVRLPAAAPVASTVGAGDAMVAGLAAGLAAGAGLEGLGRLGAAFAVAKLGLAGPNLPDRATVEALAGRALVTHIENGGSRKTARQGE